MRYTVRLIVMLLFCASAASAQWRPVQPYFMRYYGLRADSALMVPRDTAGPAADSALLGYKNRMLWIKTDTGWVKAGSSIDTTGKWKPLSWFPGVSEVTGLQDSLSGRYTKDQSDARYLQGNQTIALSGDVLGSGATEITTTLKSTGTAGTYTKVTTDAQGRVTSGTTLAVGDIPSGLPYIPTSQKGAANGVASLGSDGKVPSSQLPTTGSLYQGTWNASTNTPTIADGVGTAGWYYRVSTGGTQDLGSGDITFNAGDDVIYNGTIWQRVPAASAVSSVNGMTGDVVIDKDDVGLGNVDNTSDLAKPISTATQTALNGKEPTIAPGTTAQYWRGDKTWQTLSTAVRPLFSAGTGLTYNSTTGAFAANFGTTAGTVIQGNDSRVTGAVPNTRTITAGTGLTGGGDLSANRSFAIDPAYASFTNYYTKSNLQTSGQAAVHWGNLTNVPGSFPTTSNLQTVLSNGNTATNSIVLGAAGNTNSYTFSTIRSLSSVNYTATYGIYAGAPGASMISSDGTNTRVLRMPTSVAFPQYSPDNGSTFYEMWHSNNHPAGSAFTPTLTGANVLSSLTVNSAGHVSALTTRAMTAGDIGAAPSSGSGNYIHNISSGIQTANFRIAGHGIFYRDGSNSLNNQVTLLNAAATRGVNMQLNGDANPGLATWIHSGSTWVKRQEYFADGTAWFGGNVGIGTTSPGAKLHVNGSSIISSAGTNNVSTFNQGDGIVIAAQKVGALTTRTELDLEGETTSLHSYNPTVKVTSGVIFDARSAKGVDQYVQSTASSRLNELIMDTLRTENNIRMVNSDVFRTRLDSGAFRIQRNTTNNFTALATGNVGIGTPTPEEAMDVRGYVTASQGPGSLNNRTLIGYATGGGYIRGETHNGTSWNRASMHIDAINTLMENATVTGALSNAGARYYHTRTISATTTALSSDHVLVCNSASGNITISLPSSVGVDGLVIIVKKSSSSNVVTIDPSGSEMITTYSGDLSTMPLPAGSTEAVTLMASSGKWVQL